DPPQRRSGDRGRRARVSEEPRRRVQGPAACAVLRRRRARVHRQSEDQAERAPRARSPAPRRGGRVIDLAIQAAIAGLSAGAVYALVGMGYNVVYGGTRIFNLAQGQVLMVGVMITLFFREKLDLLASIANVFS